jgi:hypothetical protein
MGWRWPMHRKITFSTQQRDGKISIWVQMDGHPPLNVWDLEPDEATKHVLKAIESAWERGWRMAKNSMNDAMQRNIMWGKKED